MGCIILYAILFLTDACVIIFSKKWTNSKSTWSKYLFRIIMSLMWDSSEYFYYIFLWKKCDIHCLDFVNGSWSGTQYRSGILIFLQHKFIFIACHISFFIKVQFSHLQYQMFFKWDTELLNTYSAGPNKRKRTAIYFAENDPPTFSYTGKNT